MDHERQFSTLHMVRGCIHDLDLWGTPWGAVSGCWGLGASVACLWTWQTPVPLLNVASLALLVLLVIGPYLSLALQAVQRQPAPTPRMQVAQHGARLLMQPALRTLFIRGLMLVALVVTLLNAAALAQAHPLLIVFAPVPLLWHMRRKGRTS